MEKQTEQTKYNPKKSFWATQSYPRVPFRKGEKKECYRHNWRVGSFIANASFTKNKKLRIRKIGINILCYNCGKKIKAYYSDKRK